MPTDSAEYTHTKSTRLPQNNMRRHDVRPRLPSTFGFLLGATVIAIALFFALWWILVTNGDDSPWLPAGLAASGVMFVAVAAREVMMRRAWARYTHELELEMGGEKLKSIAVSSRSPRKLNIRTNAASFRDLQQRLAKAEELGAQQPEAHREAYRLCEQYLANSEEALRASRIAPDVRVALRAGQERVRGLQKYHMLAWVRSEAQRLTQEAQRRVSVSDKIETAMRAVEVIEGALERYPNEPELRDSLLAVRNFIASVKVAHWVELAERAAFRGRYSRAVARYRDALFYLSRAEMSEEAREEAAKRINYEIETLRARVATDELEENGLPPTSNRRTKKVN